MAMITRNFVRMLVLCFAMFAVTAAAEPSTVNDGIYTKAQAKAGEQLYADQCMLCHDKKYFRPVFKRSEGQSLSIMFTVMSTSMPESNPGFLSQKEYVDILAYILSLSRYATGEEELDYQDGALNDVTIEARQRK